jgi:alpha-tubulin suppressor-like RCC1 family protein
VRQALLSAWTVSLLLLACAAPSAGQTIDGGSGHTILRKADGTVWTLGANGNGQLGDDTWLSHRMPAPVQGLSDVVAVAAGGNHSLA